jgi:hypothetical protein
MNVKIVSFKALAVKPGAEAIDAFPGQMPSCPEADYR